MKTSEEKEVFYRTVSEILGIAHEYHLKPPRRNRWNTRALGNGRFPGFGLVQCFGSMVKITTKKHGTLVLKDYEEVYDFLRKERSSN